MFASFIFCHTVDMKCAELREELWSSPASMRNGFPLTMSWLEVLVLRRWGIDGAVVVGILWDVSFIEALESELAPIMLVIE